MSALKMEAASPSETFVTAYKTVILQSKIFVAVKAAFFNVCVKSLCMETMREWKNSCTCF